MFKGHVSYTDTYRGGGGGGRTCLSTVSQFSIFESSSDHHSNNNNSIHSFNGYQYSKQWMAEPKTDNIQIRGRK